ncbi:hypothetical protein Ae263Ps1_5677c [Pseudonocardia sp. Ae263_Ps1]|nr:hypothetical protein Ae150APs1_5646 [Pseudonocardia sp. Ae150A_Ps1]OLL88622.1 hypothetical protein Ae263Ps1_5677c [Pseudonocardia sp. Ae263_Ps1]OLL91357.1 hypothetical protein Ae356Ps1_1254 [Pseudonocardia sp. Ae356_Ps1]
MVPGRPRCPGARGARSAAVPRPVPAAQPVPVAQPVGTMARRRSIGPSGRVLAPDGLRFF